MIIDCILDRKDYEEENPGAKYSEFIKWKNSESGSAFIENAKKRGMIVPEPYSPGKFYREIFQYIGGCGDYWAENITRAMDYGEEEDVKAALCRYIDEADYNPEIKNYINSVMWLKEN